MRCFHHMPAANKTHHRVTSGHRCGRCGEILLCEFCNLGFGDPELGYPEGPVAPATHYHVDVLACDIHLSTAIDIVSARW